MGTLGKITEGIDGQLEVNYIDKWGVRRPKHVSDED